MAYVADNMVKVATGDHSIFIYKDDDSSKGQLFATIKAANFFANKRIIGQIKAGDIIFVMAKDYASILKVSAVSVSASTVSTVEFAFTAKA